MGVPLYAVPLLLAQALALGPLSRDEAVAAARTDAAARAGVDLPAIVIAEVERVTWRDGSLGCPEPGRAATQALVPGWRVRLRVEGAMWDYHADERGRLVLCPAGRAKLPLPDSRN